MKVEKPDSHSQCSSLRGSVQHKVVGEFFSFSVDVGVFCFCLYNVDMI